MKEDTPSKIHTVFQKKFPERIWKKVISLTAARKKQQYRTIISRKYANCKGL